MELVVPATLRYNIEATAVEDRNQRRRRDDHDRYAPIKERALPGSLSCTAIAARIWRSIRGSENSDAFLFEELRGRNDLQLSKAPRNDEDAK